MNETEVVVNDRDVWVLGAAGAMLALAFGALLVCVFLLLGQAKDAAETHAAACSYRHYLLDQARTSRKFLIDHPDGLSKIGVSAGQIRQQIDKQQAAADSLSGLSCSVQEVK